MASSTMRRILFTGGGGAGNEAIWRLMGERYELHFADADPDAIDPRIPAERRHRIPFANAPDFVTASVALCRFAGIDMLAPGVDEELPHMAGIEAKLPALLVLAPQPDYIALARDKLVLAHEMHRRGLPAPHTEPLAEWRKIGLPLIAKPRQGRGSRGVRVLATAEEAAAYCALVALGSEEIIAQEKIEGQEFTVLVASDRHGRLAAILPVLVHEKRGVTLSGETRADPDVIEQCARIHAAFPARGCSNIQLIRTAAGRCVPFEINPRISTTFCLALAAGLDPLSLYADERPEAAPLAPFAEGVALRRHWTNHFSSGSALP